MLDKRYLADMHDVVPLLLSDLWLSFWACYAHIDVVTMNPALECTFIKEANEQYLGLEEDKYIVPFQDLLIANYPAEYQIAKAFAGENAPFVKRKKRSLIYRAVRRLYKAIKNICTQNKK